MTKKKEEKTEEVATELVEVPKAETVETVDTLPEIPFSAEDEIASLNATIAELKDVIATAFGKVSKLTPFIEAVKRA